MEITKPVHPLIQELDISDKAKAYFSILGLEDIIEDKITLGDESNDIYEAMANRWSFSVDLDFCNKEDIKAFYQAVINARKKYLINNKIDREVIFDTWYEGGCFYLSLIPKDSTKLPEGKDLPFGCKVNKYKLLDEVIDEFIKDPYKGVIPLSELIDVDPSEDVEDEDDQSNYVVNVWSTTL